MAYDWFRDTPVFLYFGHSHNMLTESWGYIMKHMTFHDKSPSLKFTDFFYWPGFCCFPVAHNASVAYLTYTWFLNTFCCKNLMIQRTDTFFLLFPNLWIGMIGVSLQSRDSVPNEYFLEVKKIFLSSIMAWIVIEVIWIYETTFQLLWSTN